MKIKIIFIISAVLAGLTSKLSAQTQITSQPESILTQHWAMPTLLNPAATGDIDFIRIRAAGRLDLLGSHESPKNYIGAADAPFKIAGKRIGVGITAFSQSYGLYRNILVEAQGSYKFNIKGSTLSLGFQIGYYHSKFKGSELVINTGQDPAGPEGEEDGEEGEIPDHDSGENILPTNDVKGGSFDLGLGARFQHKYFYVGVSALHLTNAIVKLTQDGEGTTDQPYIDSKLPTTIYFDAGGNIAVNNTLITLQPSLLIGTDFKGINGVAEIRGTYNGKFSLGFDYRYNHAFGVVAAVAIKNFYVGYNWEYDYKSHPRGSTGNHELVLGYQLKMDLGGTKKFSQRSIRIM